MVIKHDDGDDNDDDNDDDDDVDDDELQKYYSLELLVISYFEGFQFLFVCVF